MESGWISDIAQQWPSFAWVVPIALVAFYVLKFLSLAYEPIEKLLGSLGARWKDSAERKQKAVAGELGILKEEVKSLSERVDGLQKRDEIYWAYVMSDENWHREDEMRRIKDGLPPIKHMSFLQFRANWLRERGRHEDFKDEDTW